MPRPKRGEVWQVDLGLAAKSRPAVILGVPPEATHQIYTYVPHTTSPLGTEFEVKFDLKFLQEGVFDAQGISTVPGVKFQRKLGMLTTPQIRQIEDAVLAWLEIE
jgi:mRNA interferase MazF